MDDPVDDGELEIRRGEDVANDINWRASGNQLAVSPDTIPRKPAREDVTHSIERDFAERRFSVIVKLEPYKNALMAEKHWVIGVSSHKSFDDDLGDPLKISDAHLEVVEPRLG
jgi:hypothetical protein